MNKVKISYVECIAADGLKLLELAEHYTGKESFSDPEDFPLFIERPIQKPIATVIEVGVTPRPWFKTLATRKYRRDFYCSLEGYEHLNKYVYKEVFDEPPTQ